MLKFKKKEDWEIPYKNPDCEFCKKAKEVPCGEELLEYFEAQYDARHNFLGTEEEFELVADDMFAEQKNAYIACARLPETSQWWEEQKRREITEKETEIQKSIEKIKLLRHLKTERSNGEESTLQHDLKDEESNLEQLKQELQELLDEHPT